MCGIATYVLKLYIKPGLSKNQTDKFGIFCIHGFKIYILKKYRGIDVSTDTIDRDVVCLSTHTPNADLWNVQASQQEIQPILDAPKSCDKK